MPQKGTFWNWQLRLASWLNWITAVAALVALVGLWFVNESIKHADNGNIDANRAWINPVIMQVGAWKKDNPINYFIFYRNEGKSPATGLAWNFDNGTFDSPINDDGRKIVVPPNYFCNDLWPTAGGAVEFPSSLIRFPGEGAHAYSGASDNTKTRVVVDDSILGGQKRFFVQGCVAYSTMTIIGRSQFCFYYHAQTNQFRACPTGNAAE